MQTWRLVLIFKQEKNVFGWFCLKIKKLDNVFLNLIKSSNTESTILKLLKIVDLFMIYIKVQIGDVWVTVIVIVTVTVFLNFAVILNSSVIVTANVTVSITVITISLTFILNYVFRYNNLYREIKVTLRALWCLGLTPKKINPLKGR